MVTTFFDRGLNDEDELKEATQNGAAGSVNRNFHPDGFTTFTKPPLKMGVALPEGVVKLDPAILCVSVHQRAWRPIKLILTEDLLICQMIPRGVFHIPLPSITSVEVVKTRVILGLNRKVLLLKTEKAPRLLIFMNKPHEWQTIITALKARYDSIDRIKGE